MNGRLALVGLVLVAVAPIAAAQTRSEVTLPASPRGSAEIEVGGGLTGPGGSQGYTDGSWITIDYGRLVNGDAIIWRAGANETTRLTTQLPLTFGSTTIHPGVYNVFVDLKADGWTFVLNTQPLQP